MKAIVLTGTPREVELVHDRPAPSVRPGYVLVDVKAVALNPTDWAHVDFLNTKDCLLGCDFAGTVAAVGDPSSYAKSWSVGERICGFAMGGNHKFPEDGAFAEQILVKADVAIRVPDSVSFEEAATLGVGVYTCGQGLVQQMGLRWPKGWSGMGVNGEMKEDGTEKERVLVYGGSCATGTLAIQFLKLAGYNVLTTASPHNHPHLLSLGATRAFDYASPTCAVDILAATGSDSPGIPYIFDTISTPASTALCAQVIRRGGRYGAILKAQIEEKEVTNSFNLAYTVIGELVDKYGIVYGEEEVRRDHEWAQGWGNCVERLLAEGKLRAHPARVGKGLEGVEGGIAALREKRVSGEKLVFVL